ncbi:MAG: hypothetical protein PHU21_04230, partial [Elusimicrobia bacterium]|nr:hypothetical protein [Elusimicrobiota bacterium]
MRSRHPAYILAAILLFGACTPEEKAEKARSGSSNSAPAAASATAPVQQDQAQSVAKSVLPETPASSPVAAQEKLKQDSGKLFDNNADAPAADDLNKLAGQDPPAVTVPASTSTDKARADASLTASSSTAVQLDDPSRGPAAPEL